MTKEYNFVPEGNEKADELAKEEAEVDVGQMAAARSLTTKQVRKYNYASIEYAAHFSRAGRELERQHRS